MKLKEKIPICHNNSMRLACHREFSNSLISSSSSSSSQNQYFICINAEWVKSQKTFFILWCWENIISFMNEVSCFNDIKINLLLKKMMLELSIKTFATEINKNIQLAINPTWFFVSWIDFFIIQSICTIKNVVAGTCHDCIPL